MPYVKQNDYRYIVGCLLRVLDQDPAPGDIWALAEAFHEGKNAARQALGRLGIDPDNDDLKEF